MMFWLKNYLKVTFYSIIAVEKFLLHTKSCKNNSKVILWFWEWEQFYSFFTLRHSSSKVIKKFTLIAVEYKFSILIFNFKIKPHHLMIVSMLMMTYVITSSPSQYVEFHSNHEQPNNVSSHHRFFYDNY